MNITEKKAEQWLKGKGEVPIFQPRRNPDFICEGGDGYEVKLLRSNSITFTTAQFEDLIHFENPLMILVFDGGENPFYRIPFSEIKDQPHYWRHISIRVYDFSGEISIRNLDRKAYQLARKTALEEDKPIGEWLTEVIMEKLAETERRKEDGHL